MVPFAGYDMPVQYPLGILGRAPAHARGAGLFDVSHMGQMRLTGDGAEPRRWRPWCPATSRRCRARMRYTLFTNDRAASSTT